MFSLPYRFRVAAPPDGDCGDPCSPESPLSPLAAASGGGSSSELSGATQLYPMRFVQLALFCLYSLSNAFQWIEYSIVANLVARYYAVDEASVNWTAIVYMVTYVPLIFPAAWLLDRRGLRFVIILGALGTCAGSWVKVGTANVRSCRRLCLWVHTTLRPTCERGCPF